MLHLPRVLFAAFNVQQMLATGVIGGGIGMLIVAIGSFFQKPKPPAEGEPAPKKLNPAISAVLVLAGAGLVVIGIIWRIQSQQNQ